MSLIPLKHHSSCINHNFSAVVEYHIVSKHISSFFKVTKDESSEWTTSNTFKKDTIGNWGLWEYDVVEMFLQPRAHENDLSSEYLEVQLSPLSQKLALKIISPRKIFYTPFGFNFDCSSRIQENVWEAEFKIKLDYDQLLFGSFSACLSRAPYREFLTNNPNAEKTPDYHRPDLFIKLF